MNEHPVEAKVAAWGLLILSLIIWASSGGYGSAALVKLMAVICVMTFGASLVLMRRVPTRWLSSGAMTLLAVWAVVNLWFWAPAVFALEPTACAATLTESIMSVPKECCCQGCDDGTIPWYICWLAGCF